MGPTESEILTNYLLQPASLPSIITFEQFRTHFPRAAQESPSLRSLYRNLQAQRNAVVDAVAANIAAEAKRGVAMRREVLHRRREADKGMTDDGEIELERAVRTRYFIFNASLFHFRYLLPITDHIDSDSSLAMNLASTAPNTA